MSHFFANFFFFNMYIIVLMWCSVIKAIIAAWKFNISACLEAVLVCGSLCSSFAERTAWGKKHSVIVTMFPWCHSEEHLIAVWVCICVFVWNCHSLTWQYHATPPEVPIAWIQLRFLVGWSVDHYFLISSLFLSTLVSIVSFARSWLFWRNLLAMALLSLSYSCCWFFFFFLLLS